jgi:hypothetical protein
MYLFRTDRMLWLRPTSLEDLLQLKLKFPESKLVVGNTELGVEIKFKKCYYPVMIQPTKVTARTKTGIVWSYYDLMLVYLFKISQRRTYERLFTSP